MVFEQTSSVRILLNIVELVPIMCVVWVLHNVIIMQTVRFEQFFQLSQGRGSRRFNSKKKSRRRIIRTYIGRRKPTIREPRPRGGDAGAFLRYRE